MSENVSIGSFLRSKKDIRDSTIMEFKVTRPKLAVGRPFVGGSLASNRCAIRNSVFVRLT